MPKLTRPVQAAIVGYGMGATHAGLIGQVEGIEVAAVCDLNPERLEAARKEIKGVRTYSSVDDLLGDREVQLVIVVTPHDAHVSCALPCLQAGKHVVVEKPMAITVAQCDAMIQAARDAGVTLSVFHNRRWDGDFMTARDIIREGYIGDVFHVESHMGGYHGFGRTWRSDKERCGGLFYDWGAHFVDWTLNFLEGRKISGVTGQFQKRVWQESTNEDHVEAYVRFDDGAIAHIQMSHIAAAGKPRWYILGTKGAIVDDWSGQLEVSTRVGSHTATFKAKYGDSDWPGYYRTLVEHLVNDAANPVEPESARRVIGVMEAAQRSSESGGEQAVPYED